MKHIFLHNAKTIYFNAVVSQPVSGTDGAAKPSVAALLCPARNSNETLLRSCYPYSLDAAKGCSISPHMSSLRHASQLATAGDTVAQPRLAAGTKGSNEETVNVASSNLC